MSYRDRFYAKYASHVQGRRQPIPPAEADAWGLSYDRWLRGWLPAGPDAPIVDVACGAGALLRFFVRRGYTNVQGVDISAEQVELARALCPRVACANALEFLAAHPASFDLITGIDVIEHLTRDEILTFTDSLFSALRPGGRVILQTPNGESPYRGDCWHGDFTHEHCFTKKTLGQVLGLSGFVGFEAREMAPVPRGVKSAARAVLWRLIRLRPIVWNYIETGGPGSGICTRVFLGSATKPR